MPNTNNGHDLKALRRRFSRPTLVTKYLKCRSRLFLQKAMDVLYFKGVGLLTVHCFYNIIPILNQPCHFGDHHFLRSHLSALPCIRFTFAQFLNSLVAQTARTVLNAALAAGPQRFIGRVPKASFDVRSENGDLRRIVVRLI